MILKELELLEKAVHGQDSAQKAVVGFDGFGFLFKDFSVPNPSYVTGYLSSKLCAVGVFRTVLEKLYGDDYKLKSFDDFSLFRDKEDFYLFGSLKTLLPTLKFGGEQIFFQVWMLIMTPDSRIFPAKFYYGPSGTSLGAWRSHQYEKAFPKGVLSFFNYSPFDFSKSELCRLVDTFEFALGRVPVSDFHGIFQKDDVFVSMGLRDGKSFMLSLDDVDDNFVL